MHSAITSVKEMGYFLLYLFDSRLTATVKNYLSPIAVVLTGHVGGWTVSCNRVTQQLNRGMFITYPPVCKLVTSCLLSTMAKPASNC